MAHLLKKSLGLRNENWARYSRNMETLIIYGPPVSSLEMISNRDHKQVRLLKIEGIF